MLACIACSTKDGGDQDGPRAATPPHGRDAGKSLTSQVKSPTRPTSLYAPRYVDHGRDAAGYGCWRLAQGANEEWTGRFGCAALLSWPGSRHFHATRPTGAD